MGIFAWSKISEVETDTDILKYQNSELKKEIAEIREELQALRAELEELKEAAGKK